MNIYDITDAHTLTSSSKIDLSHEFYSIASNSVDKLAIGGEQNKVDIHTIQKKVDEESLQQPYLAM